VEKFVDAHHEPHRELQAPVRRAERKAEARTGASALEVREREPAADNAAIGRMTGG